MYFLIAGADISEGACSNFKRLILAEVYQSYQDMLISEEIDI